MLWLPLALRSARQLAADSLDAVTPVGTRGSSPVILNCFLWRNLVKFSLKCPNDVYSHLVVLRLLNLSSFPFLPRYKDPNGDTSA